MSHVFVRAERMHTRMNISDLCIYDVAHHLMALGCYYEELSPNVMRNVTINFAI